MAANMELRSMIYGKYKNEAQYAASIGWSRQRLNKITNGKKLPDIEELNTLAETLEQPIEKLLYIFLQSKSTNGQQIQSVNMRD